MSKIMVIDDSESMRAQMEMMIQELNHACTAVGNGREALDVLKSDPLFDLVITDIFMPEMDGIETIEKISEKFPGTRIIAVSAGGLGLSGASMLEIATGMGANAVLHKPFESGVFKKTVQRILTLQ